MIDARTVRSHSRRHVATSAALALAVATLLSYAGVYAQGGPGAEHWVGTWATAVVSNQQVVNLPAILRQPAPAAQPAAGGQPAAPAAPAPPPAIQSVSNQTLREIVHTSIGGSRYRVVLTNQFGAAPLTIGAAHLAPRATGAAIGTGKPLMFAGKPSTTIPVGAVM